MSTQVIVRSTKLLSIGKLMTPAFEANFDGLVGPTHNYAGLSHGNLASIENKTRRSDPRSAALEGLEKMRHLSQLGLVQGILPPQERPDFRALHQLGFRGNEARLLERVFKKAPELLANCGSASSMWVANAATVSPSADSGDQRVHFTAANLFSKFHRSLEPQFTRQVLKRVFFSEEHFAHHSPLCGGASLSDEGAANHTRLCSDYGEPGVQIFTFGRHSLQAGQTPTKFPARQTFESCAAIARLHRLKSTQVVFAQQNPKAIDTGVFHNDVISVGNRTVFFCHEDAFLNQTKLLREIKQKFLELTAHPLYVIEVPSKKVSLADAVKSYLFNSQLIDVKNVGMVLVAPTECQEVKSVARYLSDLVKLNQSPIKKVDFVDIRQSMRNGGGPACLRLRVVLTSQQFKSMHKEIFFSGRQYALLRDWVNKYYRDRLELRDLADIRFIYETRAALEELSRILDLEKLYPFQRN